MNENIKLPPFGDIEAENMMEEWGWSKTSECRSLVKAAYRRGRVADREAQAAEPVAWRYRYHAKGDWHLTEGICQGPFDSGFKQEPLYTTAPSDQPAGALIEAERLIRLRRNVGNAAYEQQCQDWLATRPAIPAEAVKAVEGVSPTGKRYLPMPDMPPEPTGMMLVPRELVVNAESLIAEELGEDTEEGKALNALLLAPAAIPAEAGDALTDDAVDAVVLRVIVQFPYGGGGPAELRRRYRGMVKAGAAIQQAQPQAAVVAEPDDFDKMSADLTTRAKTLIVKLWDDYPEKRALLEARTGNWFAWGVDRSATAKSMGASKPAIDYCPEKLKPGGCQLHNLHCGYPACNAPPAQSTKPTEGKS